MSKKKSISKSEVLKAFLNYRYLIIRYEQLLMKSNCYVDTTNDEEKKAYQYLKRLRSKDEKEWRISIEEISEGWLNSTIINKMFNKILGPYQSEYLNDRMGEYFEFKEIPSTKSRPWKRYRLRRNKTIFTKLFRFFYDSKEIWEFMRSDYFYDCRDFIPLQEERSLIYSLSRLNDEKTQKIGTWEIEALNIPPSMYLFILENDLKQLYFIIDKLVFTQRGNTGKLVWENIFANLELSFWMQDYNRSEDKPVVLKYHHISENFNPKEHIQKNICRLLVSQREVYRTFDLRKESEIKIYGGQSK